jgi:membrane protease YdiL (CAAX protease family)
MNRDHSDTVCDNVLIELNTFEILKVLLFYPVLEELVFRKYLLAQLLEGKSKISSILILSPGFTLVHSFTDSSLLFVFLLSVFFSWTYLKTGNIYMAIFLYSFNNFLSSTSMLDFFSKIEGSILYVIIIILIL